MTRPRYLIALVFAAAAAVSLAIATDPPPPALCAGDAKPAPEAVAWKALTEGPEAERAEALVDFTKLIGAGPLATAVDDAPDCPAIFGCTAATCGGTTACYRATESSTDTGEAGCTLPNGSHIGCFGGETIHVVTGACANCPCCYGPPPNCFCPPSCGTYQTFRCE